MTIPLVSKADLQRVHRALCITVPLDQASPLLLATLTVVAHCWLKKHDRLMQARALETQLPMSGQIDCQPLPARQRAPHTESLHVQPNTDLKRRAAADFD